jgi:hypothetical protein
MLVKVRRRFINKSIVFVLRTPVKLLLLLFVLLLKLSNIRKCIRFVARYLKKMEGSIITYEIIDESGITCLSLSPVSILV